MNGLWKGIAIAGIWIGFAFAISPEMDIDGNWFFGPTFATLVVAMSDQIKDIFN